jgi:uncharacterized protein YuzE
MTITVAGIPFDHHHYDERSDVLYLNVGEPRPAARGLETPDGHAIHYDETGAVISLTLLNVRHTLAKDGSLTLTLPPEHLASRHSPASPCRLTAFATPRDSGLSSARDPRAPAPRPAACRADTPTHGGRGHLHPTSGSDCPRDHRGTTNPPDSPEPA